MKNELISIVVPIYNVEKYLEKCVESILRQTYKNIEIILVDDGSPDLCGEICENYKKIDKRITVIHKKNGGLSDARNYGIKHSNGKYITFIDSDDYVERDYIEYLYNLIKKNDCDMSICSFKTHFNNKFIDFGEKYENCVFDAKTCLENMLCEKGFNVSAWAKMYKTDLFYNVEFPYGKLCEDNGTTYKLILKCNKIAYGNGSKYIYEMRDNSIMNTSFSKRKLDLVELTDKMYDDVFKIFPDLNDVLMKRKLHPRFSILRQAVMSKDLFAKFIFNKYRDEILRNFKDEFKNNKKLDKRDEMAYLTLKLGRTIFKFSWCVYLKLNR